MRYAEIFRVDKGVLDEIFTGVPVEEITGSGNVRLNLLLNSGEIAVGVSDQRSDEETPNIRILPGETQLAITHGGMPSTRSDLRESSAEADVPGDVLVPPGVARRSRRSSTGLAWSLIIRTG